MIQKGGTIRLRKAELPAMAPLAISIEPSDRNPEVLHFKVVTEDDVRAMLVAQVIEAQKSATQAKEPSGNTETGEG